MKDTSKRKTTYLALIFVILFLAVCFMPLIGTLAGIKNPNAEQRQLAPKPEFSFDREALLQLTQAYDAYFTDQFAFRMALISLHARLFSSVLGESVSDQVIVGRDGFLYFEPTLNDYQRLDLLDDDELHRICRTLEIQQEVLARQGIDFIFVVAPNKASIYPEHMPARYLRDDCPSNYESLTPLLASFQIMHLDLHGPLAAEDELLYHRLDTHWDMRGARIVYALIMEKVADLTGAFDYDSYAFWSYEKRQDWQGDLGVMLYPYAPPHDTQYDYHLPVSYTSQRRIRAMDDMLISTMVEKDGPCVLMFRDSFANSLIVFMSNQLPAITYSRAIPYDYRLLQDDTDIVIVQIVERNIPDLLLSPPRLMVDPVELDGSLHMREQSPDMTVKDEGDSLRIYGEQSFADGFLDYYVLVEGEQENYIFPCFPVLENDKRKQPDEGGCFSVRFDAGFLSPGVNKIYLIIDDGDHLSRSSSPDLVISRP